MKSLLWTLIVRCDASPNSRDREKVVADEGVTDAEPNEIASSESRILLRILPTRKSLLWSYDCCDDAMDFTAKFLTSRILHVERQATILCRSGLHANDTMRIKCI